VRPEPRDHSQSFPGYGCIGTVMSFAHTDVLTSQLLSVEHPYCLTVLLIIVRGTPSTALQYFCITYRLDLAYTTSLGCRYTSPLLAPFLSSCASGSRLYLVFRLTLGSFVFLAHSDPSPCCNTLAGVLASLSLAMLRSLPRLLLQVYIFLSCLDIY